MYNLVIFTTIKRQSLPHTRTHLAGVLPSFLSSLVASFKKQSNKSENLRVLCHYFDADAAHISTKRPKALTNMGLAVIIISINLFTKHLEIIFLTYTPRNVSHSTQLMSKLTS